MTSSDHRKLRVGGRLAVLTGKGCERLGQGQVDAVWLNRAEVVIAGLCFGGCCTRALLRALIGAGVRAVVAESFAPAFVGQALAAGLVLAESHYPLLDGFEDGDSVEVDTIRGHLRDCHGSAAFPVRILDHTPARCQVA